MLAANKPQEAWATSMWGIIVWIIVCVATFTCCCMCFFYCAKPRNSQVKVMEPFTPAFSRVPPTPSSWPPPSIASTRPGSAQEGYGRVLPLDFPERVMYDNQAPEVEYSQAGPQRADPYHGLNFAVDSEQML